MQYDVLVAGAGTSGLPAALAAARMGKKVLILERELYIGGAVTQFSINYFEGKPHQGIQKELVEEMNRLDPKGVGRIQFRTPVWLAAWTNLMKGLDITIKIGSPITDVKVENGKIYSVFSGEKEYVAKMYIDATGDGVLSRMAGIEGRYGREARSEYGESFAPLKADRKVQQGTLLYTIRRMSDNPDDEDCGGYTPDERLIWGPTDGVDDMADPEQLSLLRDKLFGKLPEIIEKEKARGWTVIAVAPRVRVRETYRLVGDYTLSENDIFGRKEYPDAILVCNNHIDPWDPEGNPLHDPEQHDRCMTIDYAIPLRCLYNSCIDNLLFVGRCASATHVAMSSTRVITIVSVMGQAAGVAAGIALQEGKAVKDLDIALLRNMLREQGVRVDL